MRFLGMFLADPTDVPADVVAYVAEQVGAADAACLDGYMGRRATRFEHTAEIVTEYGYRDFAAAEKELVRWLDDRAWTTGEGPTALFAEAVRWLRAALESIAALAPALQADPGGEWRGQLVERYPVVRKFVPLLVRTIDFGATAEAAPVLDALRELPDLMDARATRRLPAGYLDEELVALDVVPVGWWQRLVMAPERPAGTVDRAAYVFCVLEQFHQRLRGRDIYATSSSRWTDPGARLLRGPAWEATRDAVLNGAGATQRPRRAARRPRPLP